MRSVSPHYQTLERVASQMDQLQTREQIDPVLDELEFIYEMLSPEVQQVCQDMLSILLKRYQSLDA